MTIKTIADDLEQARAALGEDTWEWLRTLALKGEHDCPVCFDEGAYGLWDDGRPSKSTAPAIPFLVRLAVAGVHSSEFFGLVTEIGHGTRDRRGAKAVAAYRAVLEQVPLLLELARTSQDGYVRRHAVRAASCGPAPDVLPVVRSLWNDPGLDEGTRAEALRAWLLLEPKEARPVATEVVRTGSAPLKVLAVAALAESGAKWRPSYGRAFAAAYDGYRRSKVPALDDPFHKTVTALASRGRAEDAEIHGYAARRLGADATEDVVAEDFLTAYRKRGSYDPAKGSARAWLHGITTNLVGRHRRSGCRCPDARTVRRMVSSPARKADHRPGDRVGRAAVEPTRS